MHPVVQNNVAFLRTYPRR